MNHVIHYDAYQDDEQYQVKQTQSSTTAYGKIHGSVLRPYFSVSFTEKYGRNTEPCIMAKYGRTRTVN